MVQLTRRKWLNYCCGICAGSSLTSGLLAQNAPALPPPFKRPDVTTDEGGLWAMMDREETRLRRSEFSIKDPSLTGYLNSLACKLVGDHCTNLRVYVVNNSGFNALAAPNGMIQIYTGMLLRIENEAQLAAILGHEIGHYLMRHTLHRMQDAKTKSAAATLFSAFGLVGALGALALTGSAFQFSRDQETEADLIGLQLAHQAGYDPSHAANIWQNLKQELSAGQGGDPTKRSVFFSTHPNVGDREGVIRKWSEGKSGGTNSEKWDAIIEPHLFSLLEAELRRGQWDESLVLLDNHIKRRPKRADLTYFKGEVHRLRGKPDDTEKAHELFSQALLLDKPPSVVFRSQATLFRAQGEKQKALQAYKAYLEAEPQAIDASLIQNFIQEIQS